MRGIFIKKKIKNFINGFRKIIIEKEDQNKLILGKQLCFSQKSIVTDKLEDIEFKVYSQWGEDGIIEYLVSKIPIENKCFIEFGVENYNESNTRFLMMNRNWSGLVIDGSKDNIEYIQNRDYFWKYNLSAVHSFITKENINKLITDHLNKFSSGKNIGLLSVDVDGVDYWILNEIACIDPSIIICEYNGLFGNNTPLTVPYDENFVRGDKHYSNLYWGANLKAFNDLLTGKGYLYIGSNQQNLNAFFVKKELAMKFLPGFTKSDSNFAFSKIRESRDASGELNFLSQIEKLEEIKSLSLVDITDSKEVKIKDLNIY